MVGIWWFNAPWNPSVMRWIITCLAVMDPLEPSVDCWGACFGQAGSSTPSNRITRWLFGTSDTKLLSTIENYGRYIKTSEGNATQRTNNGVFHLILFKIKSENWCKVYFTTWISVPILVSIFLDKDRDPKLWAFL